MEPQAKEQNQNETHRKENIDLCGGVAVHQASFRYTCNKKESECEHAPSFGPSLQCTEERNERTKGMEYIMGTRSISGDLFFVKAVRPLKQ